MQTVRVLPMIPILVCYLVGPGEAYAEKAVEFCHSYTEHSAGIKHDLLVVEKEGALATPQCGAWAGGADSCTRSWHSNHGEDIRSFQTVCQEIGHRYAQLLWCGSNCRILADNWLQKLSGAMATSGAGAVGPTGSLEAGVSQTRPNPHLRTSCFMVRPWLVQKLHFPLADTRMDAYEFEHGTRSLYRQLEDLGWRSLVVGADGVTFSHTRWADSHTYRRGEQENLLIADKQTDAYQAADPEKRLELALMAGWVP